MVNASDVIETFGRYAELIDGMIAREVGDLSRSQSVLELECGMVYAAAVRKQRPPAEMSVPVLAAAREGRLGSVPVIDRGAHHRAVYRPMLAYAFFQTFRLAYESLPAGEFGAWEEGLRAFADVLEAELGGITVSEQRNPAGVGDAIAQAGWSGLALHVAGKVFVRDAWVDLASDVFGRITRAQQADGAFLLAEAEDQPETRWYHELAILHAAASYAVQAEDRTVARAVRQSTIFHLNEIQGDHATSQPLGVFAFIWNPESRGMADAMLHVVRTQYPHGAGGLAGILLADVMYCLRLFGA